MSEKIQGRSQRQSGICLTTNPHCLSFVDHRHGLDLQGVGDGSRFTVIQRLGRTPNAEIDVVPVVESGTAYQLPDRDLGYWKPTNPPGHIDWSRDRNTDFDGRFKPLVKLFKWWKRENPGGKRPKGFVLEVLVSIHAPQAEIIAHGVRYPVRLLYPDQFPLVPAWVEPQDAEAKWSNHQYGKGGTLCLELRPDNWSSLATGADVLRSAYNLLRTENPLGEGERNSVPSAHQVGDLQSYDWGMYPVIIGAGCLLRLKDGTSRNPRALRWMAADDVWPIFVSDEDDGKTAWRPPDEDLGTFRVQLPVVVSRSDAPAETPTDRGALGGVLAVDLTTEQLAKDPIVVIAAGPGSVVPYHSTDAASVYRRKWIVLPDQGGVRSGRDTSAEGKKVAVIGVGSVGSKIAEFLLRSGIHRLVLVDGDVFVPGNLERHVLDWRDVGFRKGNAVRRRLLHIVPSAEVTVIAENLDWQRSARLHAAHIDAIAACDLILDATGDAATALMLGALAFESAKTFVSAQVFEGGLGALIARSVPGVDAAYSAGRASYFAYCEQMDVEPPPSGRSRYDALDDAGEPVVADDAAAAVAASHAARTALDVLDGKECFGKAAWLLVGLQPGWLFERHGHNIILDVGPPAPSPEETADFEARAFALQLAREAVGATHDTE